MWELYTDGLRRYNMCRMRIDCWRVVRWKPIDKRETQLLLYRSASSQKTQMMRKDDEEMEICFSIKRRIVEKIELVAINKVCFVLKMRNFPAITFPGLYLGKKEYWISYLSNILYPCRFACIKLLEFQYNVSIFIGLTENNHMLSTRQNAVPIIPVVFRVVLLSSIPSRIHWNRTFLIKNR